RDSFLNFAVEHYAESSADEMGYTVDTLLESLADNDMNGFFTALRSLFRSRVGIEKQAKQEYHQLQEELTGVDQANTYCPPYRTGQL
ncbi:MAG: hypothetical protein D3909_09090, partial [Candidatus Electrothrix sp. ATG1]|nr:hypothetical protein [Candidatus Electrothrix sp. ATG1]